MADLCHEPHPERPEVLCDKPVPCLGFHANLEADLDWGVQDLSTRTTAQTRKAKVIEIVGSAVREEKVGPPVAARAVPSAEVVESWERNAGDWLDQATATVKRCCERMPMFTTREIWLLLPNPPGGDRRKFTVAIDRAKRLGWMEESGTFQRETAKYVTADGVEFGMNKAVPIYRSLIWAPAAS
jgi:hypothetical protein